MWSILKGRGQTKQNYDHLAFTRSFFDELSNITSWYQIGFTLTHGWKCAKGLYLAGTMSFSIQTLSYTAIAIAQKI